jgi:hypothetical protein
MVPKDIIYCPNSGYDLQLEDHSRYHSNVTVQHVPIRMPVQRKGPPASLVLFIAMFIIIIIFLSMVLPSIMTNEEVHDITPSLVNI